MSDQNIISSEALRKRMYRAKLREQLGEDEYKRIEAEKKRNYRNKIKLNSIPQTQQENIIQQVVEQIIPKIVEKKTINKKDIPQNNNKITNFFKPATKEDTKITNFFKPATKDTQPKITNFFKPITKQQYLKNNKIEPVKTLLKEINKYMSTNTKSKSISIDNIDDKINTYVNKKNVSSIKPLHVKYTGKTAEKKTHSQYLSKLRTVYKLLFNTKINESIIDELQKLMDGKTYNQGIINHIQFFKNIDKIINVIKKKYTNKNTLSSYINAITSILSRIREYFPKEYDKIAQLNIDLSKSYQRERDTNDAPDKVINNLISFDDKYINKLLDGITNINDKALIAIYTLIPPRRIMDYQLMKIANKTDITKLDKRYNYIILKNKIPDFFYFLNHKTKKTQQEPKITIPTELAEILYYYIESNDMIKNNYLFGKKSTDYNDHYSQGTFTKELQKTFLKYTGKKISVNIIRASKSTHLDNQTISLAERKQIAQDMGHQLTTHLQYSKNIGLKRLNKQLTTTPTPIKPPIINRNLKRSTRKDINYDDDK
jgi:hypothetical protein